MPDPDAFRDVVRRLVEDPVYVRALTQQLETRTADGPLVERLIAYARSREVTAGHAMARKILTAAGVSWEAV
jgi:hypothetical protein